MEARPQDGACPDGRLRVLLLVHRFLPKHVGGAEIIAYEAARALARSHEVCVAYPEQVSMPSYESWDIAEDYVGEIPVRRLLCAPPDLKDAAARHNIFNPGAINALRACLEEFQPDIVHIHSLGRLSAGAVWELKARDLPIVMTLHDFWFLCTRYHLVNIDGQLCSGPKGGWQCLLSECFDYIGDRFDPFEDQRTHGGEDDAADGRRVEPGRPPAAWHRLRGLPKPLRAMVPSALKERVKQHHAATPSPQQAPVPTPIWLPRLRYEMMLETLSEVDLLISPSRFLMDRLLAFGVPRERIRFLPNGIPENRFRDVRKGPRDRIVFGYLGSLDPKKGVHDLITAFNGIRPEEARCLVAGAIQGEYAERLRAMSINPSVSFVGGLTPDRVPEFYSSIDVLVLPSLCHENSPVTIHEAYYTRTPVIAVRAGGMAELVQHGRTGFLYQRGDPTDLRSCIRRFVEEPSLVHEFAARVPEEPTVEEVVQTLESWYRALLGGTLRDNA